MFKWNKQKNLPSVANEQTMLCENLNFAGAEAYKLLRTNLMFCLPDEQGCRVIGVTSSVSGEGKSITSINLAHAIAEAGMKVVLVEADMRRPNIARRMNLKATPGLSNLLAGLADGVVQQSKSLSNLYVITSGDVPPNPSEMLAASRMGKCIEMLAERFDFVIIDLPPVNIVSDALNLCSVVDGFLLVVRQDYSSRREVSTAIRQLKIADAKILGFVMNCGGVKGKPYRYGKYKNYYAYSAYEKAAAEAVPLKKPKKKKSGGRNA